MPTVCIIHVMYLARNCRSLQILLYFTVAECLSKISELEMEVSSKEEANARLQAIHIEEVAALANDIKGLKVRK